MTNRRAFQRFDIITVLEFNLLTAIAGTFAGITRNFSYEGFCLETQCVTFEPGDSLDVSLRHPHSDLTVSVPAYVVWKRTADKFAFLMGVKLKETELDTRFRMLEIMSAAGDVPVDSFLSEGSDEGIEHEETTARTPDIKQLKTDKSVPEEELNEENAGPEAFRDEGLLSTERELITGKKSGDTFDEVFKAAQTEEPEAEDMMNEEAVESEMLWPVVEEETDSSPDGITRVLMQFLENRTFVYSSIAAVILGVSVYALFVIFQSPDSGIKSPAPVSPQPAVSPEEERSNIMLPVQDAWDNKAAAPEIQLPDEQYISNNISKKRIEHEDRAVLPNPADINTADDQTRYIQVGAWGNPDNAREMLQKLKKYYPDAYLTAGKKLNRVKIPVRNRAEINSIIKDIEDKFHLTPLVTSVK